MRDCLLHHEIGGSGVHLDHRYFYLDTYGCTRYSCGLARQAMMEFLGKEDIFLGDEWHKTLEHSRTTL
jgi:hypothetical protein